MKRSIHRLSDKVYDVAIIGGGVYGAAVAREAALRGLAVVLIEQGDFGGATSANSQRIVHGGLRYLQHGDFGRMRESIRERSTWMRIAPHLVFPMAVLVPTFTKPVYEKSVMAIALKLNDMIGFDRNRHLEPEKQIPSGRILSKGECLAYCPELEKDNLSGAALFYDAQARNTERLTISLLLSAGASGAVVVNYARVIRFLKKSKALESMSVEDCPLRQSIKSSGKTICKLFRPVDWRYSGNGRDDRTLEKRKWLKAVDPPNPATGKEYCHWSERIFQVQECGCDYR